MGPCRFPSFFPAGRSNSGGHETTKEEFLNLIALRPEGLGALGRLTNDVRDFAVTIDGKRPELRPFVSTYPVALGLAGPWQTVLAIWAYEPLADPSNLTTISPRVLAALDSLFRGYMRWVTL